MTRQTALLPRLLGLAQLASLCIFAQEMLPISGRVLDPSGAVVAKAHVRANDALGRMQAQTDSDQNGEFRLTLAKDGLYGLVATAEGFDPVSTDVRTIDGPVEGWDLTLGKIQSASTVMTVTERVIEPQIDRRDKEIFTKTLFTRDDQIFQTLGAGINLGQHAGGGKSLEVRRFGFNLDHGGTGGGLKVLLDNIQQNSISGGHAHGYLGSIKGLSPELVEDVSLINGPFNAQYGDFSGLGVVNIKTRDEMPDGITARAQYGQFNTRRLFGAYSPDMGDKNQGLIAIEHSYSDGPYIRPLNYGRNNLTGSFLRKLSATETLGFRLYGATNSYYAAGQLPVDQIERGVLDRYGNLDPNEGGVSRSGTFAGYYTKDYSDGSQIKVDGMVNRLLFDLFSNFTFFLEHPDTGDAFGQHDSRLQQAANFRYSKPHQMGNVYATFTGGANYLDNQINLKLYGRQGRVPTDLRTASHVRVYNPGVYGQENLLLLNGRLRLDFGLRFDNFHFGVEDKLSYTVGEPSNIGRTGGRWQPKASVAYTPTAKIPLTLHANYGRAVTSTNARALLQDPQGILAATTDFYQFGTSHNKGRFSGATSFFWIDRNAELYYAADSGVNEFTGPSRSYGYELKGSVQITRAISLNSSVTKVLNAFYRGTSPREYVDRAPHFTFYSALTASNWHQWSGSIRLRGINHYILNGEDPANRSTVPGHTVFDFNVARPLNRWLELNFAMDNVLDKQYYETFEKYPSRLLGQEALERVHATTGYPRTIMGGITIRLFPKKG